METQRARNVKQSGFLNDYSRLEKGAGDEALFRYLNKNADITGYNAVFIDPVVFYAPRDASEDELSDYQKLADNFHVYLSRELGKDYRLVKTPGPGVMRVQAAITGAQKSAPVRDLMSSVVPVSIALSATKSFATGKPSAVGEISMELKVTDAGSGEVLGEAVDRRMGTKNPTGVFDSWGDADAAMQYWAKRTSYVMCTHRGGTQCIKP